MYQYEKNHIEINNNSYSFEIIFFKEIKNSYTFEIKKYKSE